MRHPLKITVTKYDIWIEHSGKKRKHKATPKNIACINTYVGYHQAQGNLIVRRWAGRSPGYEARSIQEVI